MPAIWGAGIAAAGSVLGGILGGSSAKSSANAQAQADKYAADLAQQRYNQTRADLLPYNTAGQANLPAAQNFWQGTQSALNNALTNANAAIPTIPSNDTLANMPGYDFTLNQGLKATQNAAAARGLGISGAALKGAGTYATGLANSNWQSYWNAAQQRYADYSNQFSNTLAGSNATFNQLYQPITTGENAASATGTIGSNLADTQSTALQNAGIATSAGITGQANALIGGINGLSNAYPNYLGINNYLNTQALLQNLGTNPNQLSAYNPSTNGGY